jgi:hypothetical protein
MQLNSQKATRENAQGCVGHNVSQPKLRTLLHGFRELARRTVASDMCGTYCSRVDDIASSSIVARTPKRPARTEITLNHQFCARPGAFTSMGSRLNLYCGVEEGEEGGYRSALGLGGGGDGTTYRRPRCIRGGARVAPGVPTRDTPARSKGRTFAPSWLFLGWIRINLGGGALTVSWLRSFVHHLCVFVG